MMWRAPLCSDLCNPGPNTARMHTAFIDYGHLFCMNDAELHDMLPGPTSLYRATDGLGEWPCSSQSSFCLSF